MGEFTDERGTIRDLVGDSSVTAIHTVKGAVRGNHFHKATTQWTYVVSGCLEMSNGGRTTYDLEAGEVDTHEPGQPHAWRAREDTDCLVFTLGPRSGENYESDVYRLEEPLL